MAPTRSAGKPTDWREASGSIGCSCSKTRCNIYYWHDREDDIVEVHTIWGAHRERGPKL